MLIDKLNQARCGQTVTITDAELIENFEGQFDGLAYLCCLADLQSWCATFSLTLTNNQNHTYTISPIS